MASWSFDRDFANSSHTFDREQYSLIAKKGSKENDVEQYSISSGS